MTDRSSGSGRSLPEGLRRAYLEAMGIPVWVRRDAPGPSPAAEHGDEAGAGSAGASPGVSAIDPGVQSGTVPEAAMAGSGNAEGAAAADGSGREAGAPVEAAFSEEEPPPPDPAELDALAAQADAWADAQGALGGELDGDGSAPGGDSGVEAMDWDAVAHAIRACTACSLCQSRTQAVPGVGNRHADLLVIGEAPGQEEDRRGEPFVGRAGQLLDRMLAAIGLDRNTVYITNVLKCRPPNNRDPKPEEVRACAGYLRRQIELIEPKAILSVGRVSAQSLLETSEPIGRLRGGWKAFGPRRTPLLVTYHPAYLLRKPAEKRKAWADLKAVRARLRA